MTIQWKRNKKVGSQIEEPKYKHRITTDGHKFRVEHWNITWRYEGEYEHGLFFPMLRPTIFNSVGEATRFIRVKYGTVASIKPRTWRPI